MSTDANPPENSNDEIPENLSALAGGGSDGSGGDRVFDQPIEDELKSSYLTYAMSVIVSRALPDVRDGLKPSQRRILVAMNDLNLGPGAGRVKCAKISGDTSGNYHPHGEAVIYPTLVRMAQEWNMRHTLIDKQGNFGSIAGLPPAAMRYTEARLSPIAALLLDDLRLDTVDYIPTYDERNTEPTVLPSKFPNLLVNGAQGIAVGMATSIPPHNLTEVCEALIRVIDEPTVSINELMQIVPGPDFPTGGLICGRAGIRRGYLTGRGNLVMRSRAIIEEGKGRSRIIFKEIPYQATRDNVIRRIAELVNEKRIEGIHAVTDYSDLKEPVHLVVELKKDGDPHVILNQLYEFSPLQSSFSIILLALVDGKPRELTFKQLLEEFIRHRSTVIRRRTQFLLAKARKRKHTVEGLLLALANIDEIIRIIRASRTQAEAKMGLMTVEAPAAMMERALGANGYAEFQRERGALSAYRLTAVQADAILRMTLGQLVNLEQEKLGQEHAELLAEMGEYQRILADERNILTIVRADIEAIRDKHGDERRTEISHEEIGNVDMEDLIEERTMVVSISHRGYIKRTAADTYRAQRRGGKGIKGAKTEDEDPIEQLFIASTHAYLMFFSNQGKVYWQKVYDLPELARESRGRAIVNLLNLAEGEKIARCLAVRDYDLPDHYLVMATRKGLVKKTPLEQYSRPKKTGIIAINLKEGDELVSVALVQAADEILLASAKGQAVRFRQATVRSSGRDAMGVRGIKLRGDDLVVGMVVADPEASLLTVCQNGYGKRTLIGPNSSAPLVAEDDVVGEEPAVEVPTAEVAEPAGDDDEPGDSTSNRYPTKSRGTMGVRDIKTTQRNGPVVGISVVTDEIEVLMMTARGKIQRIRAADISVLGRNTQGVRIMRLDEADKLVALVTVPKAEAVDAEAEVEGIDAD